MDKGNWKIALLAFFCLMIGCGGGGWDNLFGRGGADTGPETPLASGLIPNTFIVEVKTSGSTQSEIEGDIRAAADECQAALKGKVKRLLTQAMHGFVMVLPEGTSPERLIEFKWVLRVEQDAEAAADDAISYGVVIDIPVQKAPSGIRRIFADDPSLIAKIDGLDGVGERVAAGIAILDSGIDLTHPDLNVSSLGADFTASASGVNDIYGHGTHVAGIAAALDNAFGVVGAAPGATLYPVKVLDDLGKGATSNIIAGVDWVVANADKVAVANMSLHTALPSAMLRSAVSRAVAAGGAILTSTVSSMPRM